MCGRPDDMDAYWQAETEELARTEGPQIINERTSPKDSYRYQAVCSVYEGKVCFSIEGMALMADGSPGSDWHELGGSPGMHCTVFDSFEETKIAWESLEALAGDEDAFWGWIDMGNRNFPALP